MRSLNLVKEDTLVFYEKRRSVTDPSRGENTIISGRADWRDEYVVPKEKEVIIEQNDMLANEFKERSQRVWDGTSCATVHGVIKHSGERKLKFDEVEIAVVHRNRQ